MEGDCIHIRFPGNHKVPPFIFAHILDGKSNGMLHFENLEILKKGRAQLMINNTIKFHIKPFIALSGVFDSRSAPAHR
jgi:hypothetical protein